MYEYQVIRSHLKTFSVLIFFSRGSNSICKEQEKATQKEMYDKKPMMKNGKKGICLYILQIYIFLYAFWFLFPSFLLYYWYNLNRSILFHRKPGQVDVEPCGCQTRWIIKPCGCQSLWVSNCPVVKPSRVDVKTGRVVVKPGR